MRTSSEDSSLHATESNQSSGYTPKAYYCVTGFECSDAANYVEVDADTEGKCAKECSWADSPCSSFSFNHRRPVGKQCRISKCSGGSCGLGWDATTEMFNTEFGTSLQRERCTTGATNFAEEAKEKKGCDVMMGKFETIKLCYMPKFVENTDFRSVKVASGYECAQNFKVVAATGQHECRNECGRRLGCRVFTWDEDAKECKISACGRKDALNPDKTKGCGSAGGLGMAQSLDSVDKDGCCHMVKRANTDVYKMKFLRGGTVTNVNFGEECGKGHQREIPEVAMKLQLYEDHVGKEDELEFLYNIPAFLYGAQLYTPPDMCHWKKKKSSLKIGFEGAKGVKVYIILEAKEKKMCQKLESRGYSEEPSDTGDLTFNKSLNKVAEKLAVYSQHFTDGAEDAFDELPPKVMKTMIAVAAQSADAVLPGPTLPGIIRVSGGNVSWNTPRIVTEDIVTQPGDKNWENTRWVQLPPYLLNGLYIGNHLTNYLGDGHEVVVQWPGQNLKSGDLWDLKVTYLPPTKICFLVWEKDNKIQGKMTKKYDAGLPLILEKFKQFKSYASVAYRNDGKPDAKFYFNSYCKFFDEDKDSPGELTETFEGLRSTLIAGIFSLSPMPGGVLKEGEKDREKQNLEKYFKKLMRGHKVK